MKCSEINMTDKELLQLSAKAAGLEVILPEADRNFHLGKEYNFRVWNPLLDDGDALRMAVKLEFDIQQDTDNVQVWYWLMAMNNADFVTVDVDDDRFAATRLAITKAAAEIGKQS